MNEEDMYIYKLNLRGEADEIEYLCISFIE